MPLLVLGALLMVADPSGKPPPDAGPSDAPTSSERAAQERPASRGGAFLSDEELRSAEYREWEARWEAEARAEIDAAHRRERRRDVLLVGASGLFWLLYVVSAVAARRHDGGFLQSVNLWLGPALAGAGVAVPAGLLFTLAFTPDNPFGAYASPIPGGALAALVTVVALGVLNAMYRQHFASHALLYFAGPVLSFGIPASVFWLRVVR